MKFQEAVESGLRFRRPGWPWVERFADFLRCTKTGYQIHPTLDDFLATDWEVDYPKVEITREQFWQTYCIVCDERKDLTFSHHSFVAHLANKLFGGSK